MTTTEEVSIGVQFECSLCSQKIPMRIGKLTDKDILDVLNNHCHHGESNPEAMSGSGLEKNAEALGALFAHLWGISEIMSLRDLKLQIEIKPKDSSRRA